MTSIDAFDWLTSQNNETMIDACIGKLVYVVVALSVTLKILIENYQYKHSVGLQRADSGTKDRGDSLSRAVFHHTMTNMDLIFPFNLIYFRSCVEAAEP